MSRDLRRLGDYLAHIAQAITRIQACTEELDETAFLANDLVQDGVVRNIEVIGEACHGIEVRYPEFAAAHPQPRLAIAYQMRNAVAHGYFKVDFELVWKTVHRDLPALRMQVESLRAALDTGDAG